MTGGTDFVIVGGGPAGLSAGITAARSGCSAVILEAGEVLGPRPRGEGVNHYRLFDELLGQGFLEEHALETTAGAVYHSPGASQQVLLPAKRPLYFFEWREFIDRLGEVAAEERVEVRTGARVTGVLEEGGRCVGVRYVDAAGGDREVRGATVLGCDGHASVVGRHYGLPYDRMSCPMMKCRITEAGFDPDHTQALQFYLIGAGDLAHTPSFPPCVAYAFPLSGRQMEVGLMLRMSQAHGMAGVQMPIGRHSARCGPTSRRSTPGSATTSRAPPSTSRSRPTCRTPTWSATTCPPPERCSWATASGSSTRSARRGSTSRCRWPTSGWG